MQNPKQQYISSQLKLLQHTDRLGEFKTGQPRPITLECAPTDICQLECSYCSVLNRPKNVLNYQMLLDGIFALYKMGLKSIVLTGGGDPTLYPNISEFVDWLHLYGIEIGLITNGLELRRIKNLENLTWLRISLNLDQIRGQKLGACLDGIHIPDNVTFGFSFVTDGTESKFRDAVSFAQARNPKYVRVVGNCIGDIPTRVQIAEKVSKWVSELCDERIFFSYKLPEAPAECHLGYLKPFLYADGYVYPCSSCVLGEQKFPDRFRMYHIRDVESFYEQEHNKSIVDTSGCPFCVLTEQNNFLTELKQPMSHANFI